jgi:transposase-like protein
MTKRSNLSASKRREAVLSLLRREYTTSVLAHRYGVSEGSSYRWRYEFFAGGEVALTHGRDKANPMVRRCKELEQQLQKRDRVIGELTIANRIL